MKALIFVATLVVLAFPGVGASQSSGIPLEDVVGAIDIQLSREQLLSAGVSDDGVELRALAADSSNSRYVRSRSVSLLGFFPCEENASFVSDIARNDADPEIRATAIYLAAQSEMFSEGDLQELFSELGSDAPEAVQIAMIRTAGRREPQIREALISPLRTERLELTPLVTEELDMVLNGAQEVGGEYR
ncbi:MAG: hypothetical protein KC561_05230 [Myxococcales bacterium]|nr:hypothetical protein [Myxococcales bacterium]